MARAGLFLTLLGSVGCTVVVEGVLDEKPRALDLDRDAGDDVGDDEDSGSGTDGGPGRDAAPSEPDGGAPVAEPDAGGSSSGSPNAGFTITMGAEHGCVLSPAGKATCWGENADKQLALDGSAGYAKLSAGSYHTCALTTQGALTCVGRNNAGQRASAPGPFTHVAAGDAHTCVLDAAGKVTCFGANTEGQATPPTDTPFVDLVAGPALTCGIQSTNRALRCWGRGAAGIESRAQDRSIATLSAGPLELCVVPTSSRQPECWGDFFTSAPTELRDVTAISVGAVACALDAEGSIRCWGYDPTLILDQGPYVALGVSNEAACAVPAEGPIQCAGWADAPFSPPPNYP